MEFLDFVDIFRGAERAKYVHIVFICFYPPLQTNAHPAEFTSSAWSFHLRHSDLVTGLAPKDRCGIHVKFMTVPRCS